MAFPILGSGDPSSGYNIENSLKYNGAINIYTKHQEVQVIEELGLFRVGLKEVILPQR